MSRPAGRAARLALGWVRLYTRGLPEEARASRSAEMASDLWEHQREGKERGAHAGGVAAAMLGRVVRGMPADVSWRIEYRVGTSWLVPNRLGPRRLRRQTLLPLVAAVLAALAVAAAGRLLVGERRILVGANTLVSRNGPVDATNSPSVVVNPRNPKNLAVVRRLDRPGYSAILDWTDD